MHCLKTLWLLGQPRQPFPVKIATLVQLCGSEMTTKHFKVELKKALDLLSKIGFWNMGVQGGPGSGQRRY